MKVRIKTGGYLDTFIEAFRIVYKHDMDHEFGMPWLVSFLETLYANEDGTIFTGKKGVDKNYIDNLIFPISDDISEEFLKDLKENCFEFEVLQNE